MNDQFIMETTHHFLYANDLAITAQGRTFSEIEQTLAHALEKLDRYYTQNSLKPNPTKTQVSAFYLNNKQARKELKIQWRGTNLEHTQTPTYLGITLDRTLTFKINREKIKMKVATRNNLIRKLIGTTWGPPATTNHSTCPMLFSWRVCLPSVEQIVSCEKGGCSSK